VRIGLRDTARRLAGGERGSVLVLASVAMLAVITATGLAVDLGNATSVKRNLQSVVDLASLDAVRAIGDRHGQGGGLSTQQHAEKLARESMARNDFDPTDSAHGNSYAVVLGSVDPTTRTFTATADAALQNAVQVSATTSQGWYFVPGSKNWSASAVAVDRSNAGIAVGSFLARINTSTGILNSVLGGFLGGNVTLVGYTGLAAGTVTLAELGTELGLGVGSPSQLLATNVTLFNLLDATAKALTKQGSAAAVDVNSLKAVVNPALTLKLGDLISVAQGGGDASMKAGLNVLQLIQMAAQVADGDHFASVTLGTSSLGGLGSLLNAGGNTLSLKVIEAPRIAIGPAAQDAGGQWVTKAHTAQVRAQIHLRPLGTVLGGVLDLPIYAELASANAALTGISCTAPDTGTVTVHADAQAARARVGTVNDINAATTAVTDATILNIVGLVKVTGRADISSNTTAQDLTFTNPYNWSNTKTVAGSSLGLGNLLKGPATAPNQALSLTLIPLGLPIGLGGVLSSVTALLNPILAAADTGLLDPLLGMLGVTVGGGDVTAWTLNCHARSLVN
jgi:tight adherence protein G